MSGCRLARNCSVDVCGKDFGYRCARGRTRVTVCGPMEQRAARRLRQLLAGLGQQYRDVEGDGIRPAEPRIEQNVSAGEIQQCALVDRAGEDAQQRFVEHVPSYLSGSVRFRDGSAETVGRVTGPVALVHSNASAAAAAANAAARRPSRTGPAGRGSANTIVPAATASRLATTLETGTTIEAGCRRSPAWNTRNPSPVAATSRQAYGETTAARTPPVADVTARPLTARPATPYRRPA